jgi:hypothetical protein
MKARGLIFPLLLWLAGGMLLAQEFRATLMGRVTDPTGAVVPGASILVTNTATGAKAQTKSDKTGQFTTPFLLPGPYSVVVTAPGFRTYEHKNITLQTGAKVQEDVAMQVGEQTQNVVVTTETPLIETTTATAGQVLTAHEIENLPANGRSPLGLAKTEYGVIPKQKNSVVQARPFDNSAASDFSIGGGNSQSNEYLLNGVPNTQDSSRLPGFSPLQDSVQEIRVDVFESDASYGDTSGGTVNLTTKAGTNIFHGAISEFNQFSAINAPTRWFANTFPTTRQNQFGAYLSGPVVLPKIFDGHNKLFFLYAFEGFKGSTPNPMTTTVPTQVERSGDFSALLGAGKMVTSTNCKGGPSVTYNSYQLFDPLSGKADPNCPGQVIRTPIANNMIRNINPVAAAYLKYFPLPNTTPTSADGENNFRSNVPTTNDYNSHAGRIDYSINDNNKIFFETHRSEYLQTSNNIFNNIATGSQKYTVYQGGLLDYVHTFSPVATLDARISLTRSYNNSTLPSQGFDATSLGFPGYINTNSARALPRIQFSENGTTNPPSYSTLSTQPGTRAAFDTIQFFSALTLVRGKHTIKVGPDIRQNKNNTLNPGYSSGNFGFDNKFVAAGTTLAGPLFGGSMASFLLGVPSSGSYAINPALTYNNWYFGSFVQDDWRILPNLTLNLGLRVESETSINERHNRAVVSWDPNVVNSATAGAVAAYTAKPIPELPASAFSPTGGFTFASASRRYEYATPSAYFSPRFGFSYTPELMKGRGVIRGGFGIFVNPFNNYYNPQSYGFSAMSNLVATTNNYLSPSASLSDPFPTANPLIQPSGSSLGVNTYLGQSITVRPSKVQVPYSERWNLDVQYQLSKNTSIDVGYIGNHQVHLSYSNCISCINQLPFLSRSPARDAAVQANLSSSVTNPFKGLPNMTGSLATSSTISKLSLLAGYPEYSGVSQQLNPGSSSLFNELLFRFQQRMSHGLTLNVNYEYSKQLMAQQLNSGGPLTYQENSSDFTHHIAVTGVYQLPFGRGKAFLNHVSSFADQLIGGFTVNTIYAYLSGAPISWGGTGSGSYPLFTNGSSYDPSLRISPRNFNAAFDTSKFNINANSQPSSTYNYRTFPLFYGRQDATNNLDVSILKDFHAGDRFRIQYRFEAFNVLNHTQFGTPNVSPTSGSFGTITSQANTPRVLQQGLRVAF